MASGGTMTALENRPNTALLVVDVQNGVVEGAHERETVVGNVASLVEKARRERVPVVWVQHSDEQLLRGSDAWQIVPELTRGDAEPLVEKSYGDSFENTTLESVLSDLGVGRLVVAGAQTDACIRSTLHGAFVRGYDTMLVSDAHTTEDQSAWGRLRPTRSSRTRTCTGPTSRLRGGRPGRSKPKTSNSETHKGGTRSAPSGFRPIAACRRRKRSKSRPCRPRRSGRLLQGAPEEDLRPLRRGEARRRGAPS